MYPANRSLKHLEKLRSTFFRTGLMLSLLITFLAFQIRTSVPREVLEPVDNWEHVDEEMMPVTRQQHLVTFVPPHPEKRTDPSKIRTDFQIQIVPDYVVTDTASSVSITDSVIEIPKRMEVDTSGLPYVYNAEVMPEFPGKMEGLKEYLENGLRYPKRMAREQIEGTAYVSFIVDEMGKVTQIECVRSPNDAFCEEAYRVVAAMPYWKPGMQGGLKVKVLMTLPIRFSLK